MNTMHWRDYSLNDRCINDQYIVVESAKPRIWQKKNQLIPQFKWKLQYNNYNEFSVKFKNWFFCHIWGFAELTMIYTSEHNSGLIIINVIKNTFMMGLICT